jgi:aspartate kinase
VPKNELRATRDVLEPLARQLGATVSAEDEVSKVSIVGTGMRTQTGVAQRMFDALAEAGVNMKMITTGDIKISVLVDKAAGPKALQAVHQAFRLEKPRHGADGTNFATHAMVAASNGPRELSAIVQRLAAMEDIVVSDVMLSLDQGRITIFNIPDFPGNCSRVFQAVALGGFNVDMIVENPSTPGRAQISFSVPMPDLHRALEVTHRAVQAIAKDTQVAADPNIARLIVTGIGMRSHTGVVRRMFGALAERGINIAMINTSEIRMTVVVERDKGDAALAALKTAFNLT